MLTTKDHVPILQRSSPTSIIITAVRETVMPMVCGGACNHIDIKSKDLPAVLNFGKISRSAFIALDEFIAGGTA